MPFVPSRRQVVKGMAAALPLAAVLADPVLARAAARSLQAVSMGTAGGQKVSAALAMPARTPAPTVMLIHEWWGLNDQIMAVAADLGRQGYMALAIDLYEGRMTADPDQAPRLLETVDPAKATDTVMAWIGALKNRPEANGKVGTVGWGFGGGWALNASIASPVDATVVYYGKVDRPAQQLARLKGPVLGHFAKRDKWIDRGMVSAFEQAMDEAGKRYTVHWYDADHGFANPTAKQYDRADAQLAWTRTKEFFRENLSAG
jgi:carboxymethylenebutenolidase